MSYAQAIHIAGIKFRPLDTLLPWIRCAFKAVDFEHFLKPTLSDRHYTNSTFTLWGYNPLKAIVFIFSSSKVLGRKQNWYLNEDTRLNAFLMLNPTPA